MANHPGSPLRWAVRGAFVLAQVAIAVTVCLSAGGLWCGAVVASAVVALVLSVLVFAGGIHLDMVRPRMRRRRRR